jgi:ferredoxin
MLMQPKTISINADKCKRDGMCASVCPMRIFSQENDAVPQVNEPEHCVLCGQCLAICPHGAITHSILEQDRFLSIKEMAKIDPAVVASLLRQRRSVRIYKPDLIPQKELEEIAGIAGFAPTAAHGGEGWTRSCVIVSGREEMRKVLAMTAEYLEKLARLLDGFMVRMISRWKPGPRVGRSLLPDIRLRLEKFKQGEDVITYGAPHAIFFHTPKYSPNPEVTCDAALYSVMLMAHARGMGTCWNGWLMKAASGFRIKRFSKLRELLGIPEHHEVFSAATLGYRGIKLHSAPDRRTSIRFIGG